MVIKYQHIYNYSNYLSLGTYSVCGWLGFSTSPHPILYRWLDRGVRVRGCYRLDIALASWKPWPWFVENIGSDDISRPCCTIGFQGALFCNPYPDLCNGEALGEGDACNSCEFTFRLSFHIRLTYKVIENATPWQMQIFGDPILDHSVLHFEAHTFCPF